MALIIQEQEFALDSVTSFDGEIQILRWACWIVFGLNLAMVVSIITIRTLRVLRERRSRQSVETWRPRMISMLFDKPLSDLKPRRSEWFDLLLLWNHLQESLAGESKIQLVAFARLYGLDRMAIVLLKKGSALERLIAISSFGHLKDKSAWDSLRSLMTASNPVVALAAAKAMVQIDPNAAMPLFVPQISTRREWPPSKVAAILREAGPEVISRPLAAAALYAARADMPRMIRFLTFVHHATIAPTIHRILDTTDDPEVLIACLDVLSDPIELSKVRECVDHNEWRVRMAAVSALGKIGTMNDTPLLINRLDDNEWWVRYTAARSLTKLPWMTPAMLQRLQNTRSSLRERSVLKHVIAELQPS